MDTRTQDVPGYYVWEAPGSPVVIHLALGLIDRLSVDVLRGFNAVRKRGAEVGGLLLGSVEAGAPAVVRIDDYLLVPCEYRRGPSYLFSEEDSPAFDEAYRSAQPVGYFRSHTRDGLELGNDDIDLLENFFPQAWNIALLIRPHQSKPRIAGFFVRNEGAFERTTRKEFVFGPAESSLSNLQAGLAGANFEEPRGEGADRASKQDPLAEVPVPIAEAVRAQGDVSGPVLRAESHDHPGPSFLFGSGVTAPAAQETMVSRRRTRVKDLARGPAGWVWIPFSFVFLVLGGYLGFEVSRSMATRAPNAAAEGFSVALRAAKSEANLAIRWDGGAPVIQGSSGGLLAIEDGSVSKVLNLDAAQLRNGSLMYRNTSPAVRIRLTVYPGRQISVTETLEWKAGGRP